MAYKHLPRAKPHVSGKKTPIKKTQEEKAVTSPKRPPPKTTQKTIQQTLNRRALGPQKLLKPFTAKGKLNARDKRNKSEPSRQRLPKTIPQGKMSPKKKSKSVRKPQPPAYWDEHFVVALIDDFVKCVEFQDSSSNNLSLNNVNSINYLGTKALNLNKNFACSKSVHTQTAFTVRSHMFESSRGPLIETKFYTNFKMQSKFNNE